MPVSGSNPSERARPGISTKNTEKIAVILEPRENPPPQKKGALIWFFWSVFFFGVLDFGGCFLGVQNFGPGVFPL